MSDKIYIIGTGAVAKPLAVFLKKKGKDVTLIRGSVDDEKPYWETVEVLLNNEQIVSEEIEFTTLSNFDVIDGTVVLTNKSYGNELLAEKLKDKSANSPIILLQNGLGVEEPFIERGFQELYRCVLYMASQISEDYQVSYKPVAPSCIGTIKSNETELTQIVEALNCPDFQFKLETDIQTIIWQKVIGNCVFNSICPLLDVDNGIFHRDASVFALAKRVIAECISVAKECGVEINQDALEEFCLNISQKSDGQLISTLQDIKAGRQTEIETLNLAIAHLAQKHAKAHLATETRLLGEMIKLKSGF